MYHTILHSSGKKCKKIPFVRLETPASVMIGTLGMSPFIVDPENYYTKIDYYIKNRYRHSLLTSLIYGSFKNLQWPYKHSITT